MYSLSFKICELAVLNFTCSRIRICPPSIRTTGHPFRVGSSLWGPASLGHASSISRMPSESVSLGGGHPFFCGSSDASPASVGQASSASTMPSASWSGGGGGGGGGGGAGGGAAFRG